MPEATTGVAYICKGPKLVGGGRLYCGEDVSDLILSVPEDGEQHGVTCPMCGTVTRVLKAPPDMP